MEKNDFDLKKVHEANLDILRAVDEICRKHNITYRIDSGTLLGAVRHKGFIPWDDDMDILMPREDYLRFIQIAEEQLPPDYLFQCIENTPWYPYNFGKVRAVHTLFREKMTGHLPINHGIYVDVFPMDYVDPANPRRLAFVKRWISHYTMLRYQKLKMINKKRYWPASLLPLRFLNFRITALMEYRLKEKGDMVAKLCHQGPRKPPVSMSVFDDTILVPFEDQMFRIPRAYDRYLTERYGDYRTIPPMDQRGTHAPAEVRI